MAIKKLSGDFISAFTSAGEVIDGITPMSNGTVAVLSHRVYTNGALSYFTRLYDADFHLLKGPTNLNGAHYTAQTGKIALTSVEAGDGTYWVMWYAPPDSGQSVKVLGQHFAADGTKLGGVADLPALANLRSSVSAGLEYTGSPDAPYAFAGVKVVSGHPGYSLVVSFHDSSFAATGTKVVAVDGLTTTARVVDVVMLSAGNMLVCWSQTASAQLKTYHAAIVDMQGNVQSLPSELASGNIRDAEIDVFSDGGFVITYREVFADSPNGYRLVAAMFDAAGALVNSNTDVTRNEPVFGADYETVALADGRIATFFVTTDHAHPTRNVLYLQYFDSTGDAISNEILIGVVNKLPGGIQLQARLNAAQELVVTWLGAMSSDNVLRSAVFDPYQYVATSGDDEWHGTPGSDLLRGGLGEDELYGRDGDDMLYGDADDDVLIGGAGADHLDGGKGFDYASYRNGGAVEVYMTGTRTGAGDGIGDSFYSIEGLEGSLDFADKLHGDNNDNWLLGLGGNDFIWGQDGDDLLAGGIGSDYLAGGDGSDTVSYSNDKAVTANLSNTALNTGAARGDRYFSIENLEGSNSGSDSLTGNSEGNYIWGYKGNDLIHGLGGKDVLYGNEGTDKLYGDDGDDDLLGGAGADIIDGGRGFDYADYYNSKGVTVSLSGGTFTDEAKGDTLISIEGIYGSNTGADAITGNNKDNVLFGFGGNDKLTGLGGDDTLLGGSGADVLDGGTGRDTADYYNDAGVTTSLDGSVSGTGAAKGDTYTSIESLSGSNRFADTLIGDGGDNYFWGNGGDDTIVGKAGDDGMYGGLGADTMTGGKGKDYFVYYDLKEGKDRIIDFSSGDYFSISTKIVGFLGTDVLLDPSYFQSGATNVARAGKYFIFRTTDHTLWFDADSTGGTKPVFIAKLQNSHMLQADEIYLFS